MSRKRRTLKQKLRYQVRLLKVRLNFTKNELEHERQMTDIKWLMADHSTPTYRSLAS